MASHYLFFYSVRNIYSYTRVDTIIIHFAGYRILRQAGKREKKGKGERKVVWGRRNKIGIVKNKIYKFTEYH